MKNKKAIVGESVSLFFITIAIVIILLVFAFLSGTIKKSYESDGKIDVLDIDNNYKILFHSYVDYLSDI